MKRKKELKIGAMQKLKTDIGYTRWIDARQLCSKYIYTESALYGDGECIPETYSSGKEKVVLSSRLGLNS